MSEIVWASIGTSLTVIGMLGRALYWLGGKFKEIEERFEQIEERFRQVDERFSRIELPALSPISTGSF
ncbi:hypothetical protein [Pyrobaculum arsenaticum]|uniref:Uncharacterized protein n=1 Tax=Pyrobaculum arsenaticum TaxID=121277 RepID=A0A7L4P5Q0_9CREN|nr:hypothetical protein [Pyrobaculum arsenaticum]NYR14468.1 hypothetical protein [Pyrobaculum arsenaticum]